MMLTKIFCEVYDFLKTVDFKSRSLAAEERKNLGRKQKMTKADALTILIFYSFSKRSTFKDYYELDVLNSLKTAFDYVVSYNRFLELIGNMLQELLGFFYAKCLGKPTQVNFIDSTSYEVCDIHRASAHKVFKGFAQKGKTSTGWFFGLKFHLVINMHGEIVSFYISPGNVHDANEKIIDKLIKGLTGKLIGDRGYLSAKIFKKLWGRGIKLITKIRKNMTNKLVDFEEKILLRKRAVIELVFGKLKECYGLEHSRHRSKDNFLGHFIATLCAYKFDSKKPSIYACPTAQINGF